MNVHLFFCFFFLLFLLRQAVGRGLQFLVLCVRWAFTQEAADWMQEEEEAEPPPHHYSRDKQEAQGFDFLSQRKMRWLGEKTERLLLIGAGSCRTGGADWSFRTNQGEQPAENRDPPPHRPEHTLPWGSSTGHVNKHHVAQYTIANLSILIHFFSRQFSHWRAGRNESSQVKVLKVPKSIKSKTTAHREENKLQRSKIIFFQLLF